MKVSTLNLITGASILAFGISVTCADALTVGIYKDRRSLNTDCVQKTLEQEGIESRLITKDDCFDIDKLSDLDVIYFPNGYHGYLFLEGGRKDANKGRANMTDFLAHGKGIVAGGFRSGYVRTANRPLFPEVAAAHNKPDGNFLSAKGDHPILKGFKGPMCCEWRDHVVMKTGPAGKVFLVDGDDLPVGVCGEVMNGRYVTLGMFIGADRKATELEGDKKTLLVNSIKWASEAARLSGEKLTRSRKDAGLQFLRRDTILDYTLEERGPDHCPGLIPTARYVLEAKLDSLKYRLLRCSESLDEGDRKKALNAVETLNAKLARLDENDRSIRKEVIVKINSMTVDELENRTPGDLVTDLPNRLLPENDLNAVTKQAEALLTELEPKVEAARRLIDKNARNGDLASVPALLEQCKSQDVHVRREAVAELGRIGDTRAVSTLIELTRDPDGKVRRDSIHGLGWMQAKESVPALIELAKSDDVWGRRRAVQALGQIGDRRATNLLISMIDHPDWYTAENAILALGWLGDASAVEPLLSMLKQNDPDALLSEQEIWKAGDRAAWDRKAMALTVITALGHIGDQRAVPVLEELGAKASDDKHRSLDRWLGVKECSEIALEEIKQGGRKESGIRQPDYLALARHYGAMRDRFNYFAGRPKILLLTPQFKENPEYLLDQIWSSGATGMIDGWYRLSRQLDQEHLLKFLQAADGRDLKWLPDLPVIGSSDLEWRVHKAGCEKLIFDYRDQPAFAGFWMEEVYPWLENDEAFEKFLKEKYGASYRKTLGLQDGEEIEIPKRGIIGERNKRLWAEYHDYAAKTLLEDWREAQEWLHGLRKACAFTYTESTPSRISDIIGVYAKAGEIIDVHGSETYNSQGPDNSFMMDLARDGEKRPVLCEFYNWYTPTPGHAERGFAAHLMHGESFFNFSMTQVFKQASTDYLWLWGKDRWAALNRIFLKAKKVKQYLAKTGSASKVAFIWSDRTSALLYGDGYDWMASTVAYCLRYFQHEEAMWETLNQSHIPVDAIFAETLTPEKLARYHVAVLSDAKSMTSEEEEIVRDWVRNGGVLLATGTTSLFNQRGEQENDYRLADVFGVNYKGHHVATDAANIDSYCMKDGPHNCEKMVNEQLKSEDIMYYVHREVKPEKSLDTFSITGKSEYLPGVKAGARYEYDMALGYDKIAASTAEVLGSWKNNDTALTVNRFGKGLCYFWTEIYPGLCHTASEWENYPTRKEFWPGVRELVDAMVRGGLKFRNQELPAETANCPEMVELTVRTQPEKKRWMVHLLNYDPRVDNVSGVDVTVRPPTVEKLKVFYPDDNAAVDFKIDGNTVRFKIRDFSVHDMVVVEY